MERLTNGAYKKVALDSNCFIYLIEGSPYTHKLNQIFQKVESGSILGITSILTITEILTGPYKNNDYKLVEEYRNTLLHFPNLLIRGMDFDVADKAAQYRVQYGLKAPDAIQLATATLEKADVFITNDLDFKKVDFPIIFL